MFCASTRPRYQVGVYRIIDTLVIESTAYLYQAILAKIMLLR